MGEYKFTHLLFISESFNKMTRLSHLLLNRII